MAIEFGTTRIAAQTTAAATQSNAPAEGKAKTTPVLGGESLTVTSGAMSDLEKLVARLKNENENTRQSVTQRRINHRTKQGLTVCAQKRERSIRYSARFRV